MAFLLSSPVPVIEILVFVRLTALFVSVLPMIPGFRLILVLPRLSFSSFVRYMIPARGVILLFKGCESFFV